LKQRVWFFHPPPRYAVASPRSLQSFELKACLGIFQFQRTFSCLPSRPQSSCGTCVALKVSFSPFPILIAWLCPPSKGNRPPKYGKGAAEVLTGFFLYLSTPQFYITLDRWRNSDTRLPPGSSHFTPGKGTNHLRTLFFICSISRKSSATGKYKTLIPLCWALAPSFSAPILLKTRVDARGSVSETSRSPKS